MSTCACTDALQLPGDDDDNVYDDHCDDDDNDDDDDDVYDDHCDDDDNDSDGDNDGDDDDNDDDNDAPYQTGRDPLEPPSASSPDPAQPRPQPVGADNYDDDAVKTQ